MASSLHFFIFFLAFTVVCSESAEILTIYEPNLRKAPSVGISVSNEDLHEVANSVLLAETWLRNYVLPYYPASNITHILVAHNLLCSHKTHHHHHLILPALKNLHHSLTRWGLHSEIKLSPTFSSLCLTSSSSSHHHHRHHSSHSLLVSLLHFLNSTNSSYLINPTHEFNPKFESLAHTHLEFVKKISSLTVADIKWVKNNDESINKPSSTTMRKLSYVLPTAEGPLPPLIGVGPMAPITSPPSPTNLPHPHHNHHHNLPPCNPWAGPAVSAPPPQHASPPSPGGGGGGEREKLWCVAKPSVPAETLQEAMDYACGEGGAECDEIQPSGSCYYPDTVVAHASYAFNSYWQKNKMNAGSCSFGGTAMVINSDPSFLQCRFSVS